MLLKVLFDIDIWIGVALGLFSTLFIVFVAMLAFLILS